MTNSIMRREIVLLRMFNGEYLDGDIGHEIINMFRADNGKNYIYILPGGDYGAEHYGKIGYVFLTRGVPGKNALEVLALAKDLEDVFNPTKGRGEEQWVAQQKILNNVSYGEVHLFDILARSEEAYGGQPVWITMYAGSVKRPKHPVYIAFRKSDGDGDANVGGDKESKTVFLKETNKANSSQKQYIFEDNSDYETLIGLINDCDLWTRDTEKITLHGDKQINEDNFFDICGIADWELAFSNALAHFFKKYPSLTTGFLNDALKAKGAQLSSNFVCLREWENIDLLIEDDREIIVVENKIKSSINGIQKTNGELKATQLDKYWKIAEKRAKGEYLDADDPKKLSLAVNKKKVFGLVLTPNYNTIKLEEYDTAEFKCSDNYISVRYSDLYQYFAHFAQSFPRDSYFLEFLKGIKPHTEAVHNDLFKIVESKFRAKIRDVKDRSKD